MGFFMYAVVMFGYTALDILFPKFFKLEFFGIQIKEFLIWLFVAMALNMLALVISYRWKEKA